MPGAHKRAAVAAPQCFLLPVESRGDAVPDPEHRRPENGEQLIHCGETPPGAAGKPCRVQAFDIAAGGMPVQGVGRAGCLPGKPAFGIENDRAVSIVRQVGFGLAQAAHERVSA